MSTNALIVFKNKEDLCTCIFVNYDGYIENGVGETLYNYWHDNAEVEKLCSLNKEIRCFGSSIETIEFFEEDPESIRRSKTLKNISFKDLKRLLYNYCYIYMWEEKDPGWKLLKNKTTEWIGEILNY